MHTLHRRHRLVRLARQLVLYGVFGGAGALTDLVVYLVLVTGGTAPVLGNVASVCCGITVSFLLNSRFNFRRTDRTTLRLTRFFSVGLTGLALSTALLALLTHRFEIDPTIAKLATIPPVVALQFLANRTWTFAHLDQVSTQEPASQH